MATRWREAGEMMFLLGLIPLFILVIIMVTGQPTQLTGACRYCPAFYTYTVVDAPIYLWLALGGNAALVGAGAVIAMHEPITK